MSRILRRKRAILIPLVAALVGIGTMATVANGAGSAGGTLTARHVGDWINFDFQRLNPSFSVFGAGPYDRLVALGPGAKVVPYLASSWVVTPSKITFTIRQGAKCQSGTPVTTKVVLDSFKRLLTVPKLQQVMTQYFGPGPYAVSADLKKNTFTFRTGTPYNALLLGFIDNNTGIVCPDGLAVADQGKLETEFHGSGPYELVTATHGDQVVMKLRSDAWNWGPVINGKPLTKASLPDTQVWKIVNDDTTAANLLTTGGLDIGTFLGGPDVDRLIGNPGLKHTSVPIYFTQNLAFNQDPGKPGADPVFREAAMMMVNPDDWNKAALGGRGTRVTSFIPTNAECYDPKTKSLYPKYDEAGAKALLTKAGYKNVGSSGNLQGPDGTPIKFNLLTFQGMGSGGEYLQSQLAKLGAQVELRNLIAAQYGPAAISHNWDLAVSTTNNGAVVTAPFLGFFFGTTYAKGGQNVYGAANDPVYDRYFRLATSTVGKESCAWYAKAQELLLQKHYWLPIIQPVIDVFTRPGVTFIRGPRITDPILMFKK
jgi:peptide/nickel transport system substrate-binding protein